MATLTAFVDGIGLIGPGLTDWPAGQSLLAQHQTYRYQKTILPAPSILPPAERRRCGPIVKLSIAVGLEAAAAAGCDAGSLPTVFSASGGDGDNCHQICEMLASDDRLISPTRFHNSVHNAASGYWSIATGAMASSSVLCAYDASFGAGLLETMAQVVVDDAATLLIACDTPYPVPLREKRTIPDDFGVALMLSPRQGEKSIARIDVALSFNTANTLEDPELENLRTSIPAARSLPLLQAIARNEAASLILDYLDSTRLAVKVLPCG